MIKHNESATWLATALLAFSALCGYLAGLFIGHTAEVVNGLFLLPVLASMVYLAIAWLLNWNKQDEPYTVDITMVQDVMSEVYSDNHEIIIFGNGICGIDDPAGQCEIDFNSLDEMYEWSRLKREELDESY